MTTPYLSIDLDKIEHNARTITGLCGAHGIAVTGVTKATCGDPQVAAAMLRGGVIGIADSRLDNIRRLRDAGIAGPLMLLRLAPLSAVDAVVQACDIGLNAEPAVLQALSEAAVRHARVHEVILMVELGDLREGVPPDELLALVGHALRLPGIRILGLGANLACLSGVVPSARNMQQLVGLVEAVEQRHGAELRWISGINSSGLDLIAAGRMPKRVSHARIGEAILLGRETTAGPGPRPFRMPSPYTPRFWSSGASRRDRPANRPRMPSASTPTSTTTAGSCAPWSTSGVRMWLSTVSGRWTAACRS